MKTPTLKFGKIVSFALAVLCLVSRRQHIRSRAIWANTGTDFNAAGSWTGGSPPVNNVGLIRCRCWHKSTERDC